MLFRSRVADIMRTRDRNPVAPQTLAVKEALLLMTTAKSGSLSVVNAAGKLTGVFTDGDLRRLIEKNLNLSTLAIGEVMGKHPRTIKPEQLAVEAVEIMETHRINQLLVCDANNKLVGALHIHDLTRAKVI